MVYGSNITDEGKISRRLYHSHIATMIHHHIWHLLGTLYPPPGHLLMAPWRPSAHLRPGSIEQQPRWPEDRLHDALLSEVRQLCSGEVGSLDALVAAVSPQLPGRHPGGNSRAATVVVAGYGC